MLTITRLEKYFEQVVGKTLRNKYIQTILIQTSLIITVQDVYDTSVRTSTCAGTMLRNVGYMVLFPDIRYSALIRQLARMYFVGEQEKLVEPFKKIVQLREKQKGPERSYLVLNFLTSDPRLQITENGIYPSAEMQVFE
jgi:hypothetical protein